ncbi:MAG TPA: hypothetical protein VJ717_11275 [Gemmatimonadaceae bacterium]|nr:hypothetical protein [Gemmatimonadaceae bacterium]
MTSSPTKSLKTSPRSFFPVAIAAAASFALAVIGTVADGWPLPRSHDEFSYVLAAETFASGRLTNPAYPLPAAIETMHVLQQPSYASKYLPGHSLFLALGIALGGSARLGQWLAFAFMGAAMYWMLTGWLPRRAAAFTAGIMILVLADTEWASGYWGSSLAVAGSALLFGSIRRLDTDRPYWIGVLLGLGAMSLALTRPAEGLAASLLPACYFVWWFFTSKERQHVARVTLGGAVVVAFCAVLLGAHNKAVTGNALRLPYTVYEQNAAGAPPFTWQPVKAVNTDLRVTQSERLRFDLGAYSRIREHWLSTMWYRAKSETLGYYLPDPKFAIVLLLFPFAMRDRRSWILVGSVAAVGVVVSLSSFFQPHYLGPALPPLIILYALGCGVIARFRWSRHRVGRGFVAAASIWLGSLGVVQLVSHGPMERVSTSPEYWARQREAIAETLRAKPGKHVVFVRYAPTYKSQNEWVQNGADLLRTQVLWAHDLGSTANDALLYFEADRTAWLLTVHGRGRLAELTEYDRPVTDWRTLANGGP